MKIYRLLVVVLCCTYSAVFAEPLINAWSNPVSGNWQDLQWSLGIRPGPGQTIAITNQGWKAVAIGPNTVQQFPETLDVSSVILGGYTDSFNTVLLNYTGFETPFNSASITIGTNSAFTALASVLNVLANGSGPGELTIFSVFNQGENALVNANSITLGNLSSPGFGYGTYNLTNGSVYAAGIAAWNGSTFNQFDGATTVDSLELGGANVTNIAHYKIENGSLTAGLIELQRGDFNQTGGSVNAALDLGAATYSLSAGTLHLPGITIPNAHYGPQNPGGFLPYDATLLQTGGTNFCDGTLTAYREFGAPGVGVPGIGPGRYILSNGVLYVSSPVRAWLGAFVQWGGWHTNAGTEVRGETFPNFEIRTGTFTLGGGTLITPSIAINLGQFSQSGGTNHVSGEIGVGTGRGAATFGLTNGLLTDLNTTINGSSTASPGALFASFTQSGGAHIITNLLRLVGPPPDFLGNSNPFHISTYTLGGGVLNVPNIQIATNAVFNHNGGTLTTSGLLNLGSQATWNERTSGQQFGQLLLSAPAGSNATFSLPSGNCIVRFVNSSSVPWSNQVTFFIDNWNGSPAGGGQHQVIFGSNSSGLTSQQISQIKFRNVAGGGGTASARILSTGEIVPDRFLTASKSSDHLVIEWGSGTLQSATNVTGPYQDVNGATSPYNAPFTGPQRFFRLRD